MRSSSYVKYETVTASVISKEYREYLGEISIFFNDLTTSPYQSVSMTVGEAVTLMKSLENALKEYYEETERGEDPNG